MLSFLRVSIYFVSIYMLVFRPQARATTSHLIALPASRLKAALAGHGLVRKRKRKLRLSCEARRTVWVTSSDAGYHVRVGVVLGCRVWAAKEGGVALSSPLLGHSEGQK